MKVKEFAVVVSGATPKTKEKENWGGDNLWITPAEIKEEDKYIYATERNISEKGVQSASLTKLPKDTILLSSRAPIGKVAIVGKEMYCNQGFKNLICNTDIVIPEYIYYWLKSKKDYLNSLGRGATFKEISKSIVENIEIPMIAIEAQKKVIKILDHLELCIKSRKQQISEFDLLVKSQFVELFGDPMINPKGWQEIKISEVVDGKVSNGFFAKRNEYVDDGNVAVLGVSNVVNRMYSQCQNLPKANGTDRDIEKYGLKYGDMLFCRSSLVVEGIGKASIVPQNVPEHTLFECHVIRLPLDLSKCVPEFIQVLTTTNYFRTQIISQAKTSTMTTIGQDGILKSNIILPPLDIQNTFLNFVQQIDKSKLAVQKSLEELETLKQALMQQYFGRKEV